MTAIHEAVGGLCDYAIYEAVGGLCVLPRLCCDAIPQQDFNPMLFPISVQVECIISFKIYW